MNGTSGQCVLMFHWLLDQFPKFFVRSTRLHLRQVPAQNMRQLVSLMDRFVDGRLQYDLEWDDFISWESSDPPVEEIRERLGAFESLLFSNHAADRNRYNEHVADERNRLATLFGLPAHPIAETEAAKAPGPHP
ncbi:MAG: hypothetical protein AB7F76_02515 [Parvibaculaceae bacterium]